MRWVLVKGRVSRDDAGRPVCMSGTILDVTARKRDDWAQRLFADASAGMASLDAATCARGVARAVANRFADWALVHVRDFGGVVLTEVAASKHVAQPARTIVRELWAKHVLESPDIPLDRPLRFPSDDHDAVRHLAESEAHARLFERIDPCSWMVLPLHVRGAPVGALTVARTRERSARYDERDLATFTELARRISIRLENAFLFAAEQHQRARFQALVEATSQVVWATDARGVVKDESQSWQKFTGVPARELARTGGVAAVHPDDRERAVAAWHAAVATGALYEHELRLRRVDGEYHWAILRATPVRDVRGHVVEWIGVTVDVQEQREVRARLERSEASYRRIVETANEGIWTITLDGVTTFANHPGMAEILDTTVEDLVGRSVFDFLFPEDVDAMHETLALRAAGHSGGRASCVSGLRAGARCGRAVRPRRSSGPRAAWRGRWPASRTSPRSSSPSAIARDTSCWRSTRATS